MFILLCNITVLTLLCPRETITISLTFNHVENTFPLTVIGCFYVYTNGKLDI